MPRCRWTGVGLDAGNTAVLQLMTAALVASGRPFVVGGDWNRTPGQLRAWPGFDVRDALVAAPLKPTCNGWVIDFFLVPRVLADAIAEVSLADDIEIATHSAVQLKMRTGIQPVLQRRLVCPVGWHARPPPVRQPPSVSWEGFGNSCHGRDEAVSQTAAELYAGVEEELVLLVDMPEVVAIKATGRGRGPRFRMMAATSHNDARYPRASAEA